MQETQVHYAQPLLFPMNQDQNLWGPNPSNLRNLGSLSPNMA
jgi:hypothetical protein